MNKITKVGLGALVVKLCGVAGMCIAIFLAGSARAYGMPALNQERMEAASLEQTLRVGDVVFIRVPHLLYRKVADANASWTNHVGVVVGFRDGEAVIAESRVPRAGETTFGRFVRRSEHGRVAVRRLHGDLGEAKMAAVVVAARERYGQWYDLGFNYRSGRQFCSKFVHDVLWAATGESVGEVETFAALLARHPAADQGFWRWWFLGSIPWQRETITPASQYQSPALKNVFDGWVVTASSRAGHNSPSAANPL